VTPGPESLETARLILHPAGVARRIGMVHERNIAGRWGERVAIYRGWPAGRSPGKTDLLA
jgi:hypothetical protein